MSEPLGTARHRDHVDDRVLDVLQKIVDAGDHGWRLPDRDVVALLATGDLARFDLIEVGERDPWRFYATTFAPAYLARLRAARRASTPSGALSAAIDRHTSRAIRR